MKKTLFQERHLPLQCVADEDFFAQVDVPALEAMVKSIQAGAWVWNMRSGEVVFSPDFAALLQYTSAELALLTPSWRQCVMPQDMGMLHHALGQHVRGKTPFFEACLRLFRKDGSCMKARIKGRIVERDAVGKALRMAGTLVELDSVAEIYPSALECKNSSLNSLTEPMKSVGTAEEQDASLVEQYITSLLEIAPFGCQLWDSESKILYCNTALVRMFEFQRKEEFLEHFFEISPSVQPDGSTSSTRIMQYLETAREKGVVQFQWRHRTLKGTLIPVEVTLVRVYLGHSMYVAGYTRDLRQIKDLESALRLRNHELTHGNALLQTVNTVAQILLSSDEQSFNQAIWEVLTLLGEGTHVERVYIWKNHVKEDGRLYCDQVYEWSQGAEPQQGTKFTVDISYDDVVPTWKKAFAAGEGINGVVKDMSPSEQAQLLPQGIVSLLVRPIVLNNGVWGFIGFDDCHDQRTWSAGEESILAACGMLIAASIQKHQVAVDLRQTKEMAEEGTKAKSEFLARMSHEIRTPMNAILGLLYLCLQSTLNPQQRDYIIKAQTAAQNLLGIINDILDFSKIEANKLDMAETPFSLDHVLENVCTLLAVKAQEKNLQLECVIAQDVPRTIVGDSMRLQQILLNLGGNAVKFTEQGSVEIRVTLDKQDADTTQLQVSVIDTGPGLTEEEQSLLFQPFSQMDGSITRRYGGTGLGLAITKQLVELMGGEVGLRSVKGGGCDFFFTIPCVFSEDAVEEPHSPTSLRQSALRGASLELGEGEMEGAALAGSQSASDAESAGAQAPESAPHDLSCLVGRRVLLVEDNDINQLIAERLLEQVGLHVTIADNGLIACEMLQKEMFDLVLMDIQMPIMDGLEASRNIRSQARTKTQPPIIAMTANAMERDKQRSLEAGMNAHITKPFEPENLYVTLKKWLAPA